MALQNLGSCNCFPVRDHNIFSYRHGRLIALSQHPHWHSLRLHLRIICLDLLIHRTAYHCLARTCMFLSTRLSKVRSIRSIHSILPFHSLLWLALYLFTSIKRHLTHKSYRGRILSSTTNHLMTPVAAA